MADVPYRMVEWVRETQSVKGSIALSWRAGLSAKTAEVVQERLAKIEPSRIKRARGSAYPMSDNEMIEQIEIIRKL